MQLQVETGRHRSRQEHVISQTEYDALVQKVAQLEEKLLTVHREQDGTFILELCGVINPQCIGLCTFKVCLILCINLHVL